MKRVPLFFGAILAAVAASSCCILPLLLGAASVGTVGLGAALAPYRPYLVGLTVLLLGAGFYFTYRPQRAGGEAECCDIKTVRTRRMSKAVLWTVALFTVAALAYPEIARYRVSRIAAAAPAVAADPSAKTAVFTIGNMTCAECTLSIASALKAKPGVLDARVDFAAKQALVQYDPGRVNVATLRTAIDGTGFPVIGVAQN